MGGRGVVIHAGRGTKLSFPDVRVIVLLIEVRHMIS